MSGRQRIQKPVLWEATTAYLTFLITDGKNNRLQLTDIHSVKLTLYEEATSSVLNGRNDVDVKNINGGVVAADGAFQLELSDADNALLSQDQGTEWHIALITWTWASGSKTGYKEVGFKVSNQTKVGV